MQKLDGMTKLTGVNSYVSNSYVQRVALQDFAGPQAASAQQFCFYIYFLMGIGGT